MWPQFVTTCFLPSFILEFRFYFQFSLLVSFSLLFFFYPLSFLTFPSSVAKILSAFFTLVGKSLLLLFIQIIFLFIWKYNSFHCLFVADFRLIFSFCSIFIFIEFKLRRKLYTVIQIYFLYLPIFQSSLLHHFNMHSYFQSCMMQTVKFKEEKKERKE